MSKVTKRYEELSTRANNVLFNAGFEGNKDNFKEMISGLSVNEFNRRYANGGKVTYWELRKWCGLGDNWVKDPCIRKTEISYGDLTLTELLNLHKLGGYWSCIKAREEIIRRFDLLQGTTKNTINHPAGTIHQGSGE